METIKNVAASAVNTANTYIYGNTAQPEAQASSQSGTEPISGETGKGTVEDPYDRGNTEPSHVDSSEAPKHTETPSVPSEPTHTSNFGSTDPSTGANPSSGAQPEAKHQGGNRPTEVPTGEQDDAVKETKDEGEEALKRRDPNDHSGEPMRMHDGSDSDVSTQQQSHPGQDGGDEHGKDKGTGEQWIKSSGLQAEGGDFDASKPGAGREADRLLEQKGIQKDGRGAMIHDDGSPVLKTETDHSNGSGHSKVKTLDKIKEKLHIGKH